jgi:tripeptide aminopeptidase
MVYANKKRILETFVELVKIYSPSKGEQNLAKLLIEKLSLLNLDPLQDDFGNIIATLQPKEGIQAKNIFLSGHLDVVEPCKNIQPVMEETEDDIIIKSDGTTVLGADDKAGLAMILEAITCIVENDLDHGRIEIVLTLQEENGLVGSKEVNIDTLESTFGYVLDHSAPIGTAISKAPQHDNLTFIFKGKPAHAGLHPEEGISAILLASNAVSNMPVGRLDEETTANVGTIQGGLATNIIPDECTITCEVRSHDIRKVNHYVEKYIEAANDAVKQVPGTSVKYLRDTEYRNIQIPANHELILYARKAAESLNLPFISKPTCGGSDANVFNHRGLPAICLGCGYSHPHSTKEFIPLSELSKGADYVVALIQAVIEEES